MVDESGPIGDFRPVMRGPIAEHARTRHVARAGVRPPLAAASLAFGLLLSIAVGTVGERPCRADVPGAEIARKRFEEGQELEKGKQYEAALAKFRESEQIKATAGNRFHQGYCLEMLGRLVAAVDEYESAEKIAREQKKTDILQTIKARLDPLRPRLAKIALKLGGPPNTEVKLDANVVAPALLGGEAFRVDPGAHTITATAPSHASFSRNVKLAEGETSTLVTITLTPDSAGATAPAPVVVPGSAPASGASAGTGAGAGHAAAPTAHAEPAPAHPTTAPPAEPTHASPPDGSGSGSGRSYVLPIATTAGTVALAGAGVVSFLLAGSAHADAERDCAQKIACDDEQSKIRTLDAVALGSFIGAAGLGALSVILWVSPPTKQSGRNASLVATPSWAGVRGAF